MLVSVRDASAVGQARRTAVELARLSGMGEEKLGGIGLVATELATNLVKHGGGGSLGLGCFADADGSGFELLSLDSGPGIPDVDRSLADGYSTAGSAGTGLGAIIRQSDRFAIFSRPGFGTAIMARFLSKPDTIPPLTELGSVVDPYPGESVCGDGWSFVAARVGRTLLMADGSGHGTEAKRAADIAIKTFTAHQNDDCVALVERIHRALAPTRGAAVAIARIDAVSRIIRYVGVGNIAGTLVSGGATRRMVSHNGTAGHIAPRIREFTYPFTVSPIVILHSDGLTTKWELDTYPGLATQHPSLIAGVLFRDHRRGRDDASIVAMRAPQ